MNEQMTQYRATIDHLDAQITALLAARFQLTEKIGRYKKNNGLPVVDAVREQKMLHKQAEQLVDVAQRAYIFAVWEAILDQSKRQQSAIGKEMT